MFGLLHLTFSTDEMHICKGITNGTLLADKLNPMVYFACINEQAFENSCETGFIFIMEQQHCIEEYLDELQLINSNEEGETTVEVHVNISTETVIITDEGTTTTTETSINTSTETIVADVNLLFEIPSCPCMDTYLPTYFASRDYCNQYFMCYRSRPLLMSCCRGYHWSAKLEHCVPEYESECEVINY